MPHRRVLVTISDEAERQRTEVTLRRDDGLREMLRLFADVCTDHRRQLHVMWDALREEARKAGYKAESESPNLCYDFKTGEIYVTEKDDGGESEDV